MIVDILQPADSESLHSCVLSTSPSTQPFVRALLRTSSLAYTATGLDYHLSGALSVHDSWFAQVTRFGNAMEETT